MNIARNNLIFAITFVSALVGGTPLAGERIDQTLDVPAAGTVSIENLAGSVTVSVWDRNAIRVEGELDDRVERLEFENDGSFTRIKVIYPHQRGGDVDGTHLDITVPAASRLEIDGVSSEVDVHGVTGRVRVDTISGDISADGAASEYALESISGNIRLQGTGDDARIKAATISGDIRLGNAQGELEVSSVSGNVQVSDSAFTRIEAANTSGDIDITGKFADGGTFRFKSISGDVTLRFVEAPSGIFDITTFSGGIDNDFGPEPQRTGKYAPGMELKFREGDAETSFRVNTLSGDISLQKE
ncbi:MAG TPA: DUF4097 family beta strand repeat-containing protein [Gammaproteobacteria bacterium]